MIEAFFIEAFFVWHEHFVFDARAPNFVPLFGFRKREKISW
jgi:hypothetical protein